ncbi:MAG: type IX secretion system membrane protein PorP/SprF [Crocinitomix sp.]|nr:type IX secretion system membrane protein PorP/SprF [Crocinitomix sp.]
MKKSILILTVLLTFQSFAQQDAVYSQYMYNQFVINPAYAGSRNAMSAVLMHRTRWMGMDGAPTTSTFSFHSNRNNKGLAWGANFAADRLGPQAYVQFALAGAYHARLRKGKLSFALRAGIFNSSLNRNKLDFRDTGDFLAVGTRHTAIAPSIDFGVFYYTRKFYVGLSLNHLGNQTFDYSDIPTAEYHLRSFNTLGAGYAFEISEKLTLKPSFLVKQSDGFDANMDLNLSALFYKRIWFGISLRNKTSVNFLLDVNITDYMRVGYAYDLFINNLNSASSGAHEIFIGFDFNPKKTKTTSTRYL